MWQPLPLFCPCCGKKLPENPCQCVRVDVYQRDMQRLGADLREARRQATHWRQRCALLESLLDPSTPEETP